MNELIYIACCMGLSFIVGLGMGIHIGHVTAWEAAERKMHGISTRYSEEMRQLRLLTADYRRKASESKVKSQQSGVSSHNGR